MKARIPKHREFIINLAEDYEKKDEWKKKMLVNIAMAGFFSSDRTIAQYNEDIWKLKKDEM